MTTFSQIVDDLVAESRRKDMQLLIEKYVNQTIRDVHFNDQNSQMIRFGDNRNEAIAFGTAEPTHVWPIPKPQNFARIEVIYCPNIDMVAIERNPAQMYVLSNLNDAPLWYRTGPTIAISGYGSIDDPIQISWWSFPRRLSYVKSAEREVMWDEENEEFVFADTIVTPEDQEAALERNTNWLLQRWSDVIREGCRAKLYKRLSDETRTRMAFSAFESGRKAMVAAEAIELGTIYVK